MLLFVRSERLAVTFAVKLSFSRFLAGWRMFGRPETIESALCSSRRGSGLG
ncbi:hypothetical protein PGTUg99_016380 [Puccinia graminis f. sp. tritici]|uniref:Uncharacterized protein n=1 Tax=Puccinia graminis f. sp. tritici TaxID=56615 RepID=A0A5B0RN68_PUCGR|nr:hypothetical protein PGTUg99_016380 [Puccinia graminis f. sp. tritici]